MCPHGRCRSLRHSRKSLRSVLRQLVPRYWPIPVSSFTVLLVYFSISLHVSTLQVSVMYVRLDPESCSRHPTHTVGQTPKHYTVDIRRTQSSPVKNRLTVDVQKVRLRYEWSGGYAKVVWHTGCGLWILSSKWLVRRTSFRSTGVGTGVRQTGNPLTVDVPYHVSRKVQTLSGRVPRLLYV